MYDLLIKGGKVIDPSQKISNVMDLAIQDHRIARLAKDIPASEAREVIDAAGNIVTPGLIDIHCHVYPGVTEIGILPDDAGLKQGVTTVVDAGSAGQATFGGLTKYVIPQSRTNIFCFLHLCSVGLSVMPELGSWNEINVEAAAAAIESNRDIIKGVKLRLTGPLAKEQGAKLIEIAKKLAGKFNLPVMIHLGDLDKSLTRYCLTLMEPGDIVSHIYTPQTGSPWLPDGGSMSELVQAMRRGVMLDVAPGMYNFSFEIAQKGLAQGIIPTTISSDLTSWSLTKHIFGLTVTMSRFLALGLSMEQLIEMTTINPARVLGIIDRAGSLEPEMPADVSILKLVSGKWRLKDTEQKNMDIETLIQPVMAIKSGQPLLACPVAQLSQFES
jgi:dihydroorotase